MKGRSTKIRNRNILWSLAFIYTIVLFFISPMRYDFQYNLICGISYVVLVGGYFKTINKSNYMDFDTMFFIAFFFVSFFYPIFIYPINPQMFWMFQYATDTTIISKASALCLIGITSYMIGSIGYKPNTIVNKSKPNEPIKTNILFLISVSSFILYIMFGGYAALKNTYANGERDMGGIYAYFSIVVYVCIFSMIAIWFMNSYNISKQKIQWKCFPLTQVIYILTYMCFLIAAGSRGKVLNIILMSVGLYAYLYKSFSFRKVILLSFIGMIGMFSIMVYRSGNVFSAGSISELAMDLIINNHNTYEGMSIVENSGLSYGKSMLAYVLGIIPFLQNTVFSLTGIDPDTASSAMIITQSTLGTTSGTGTGTTIIADIYIAFGLLGVILFMGWLGRFIQKTRIFAKQNIYYLAIYGILTGMSVYIARAEFFYPAKTLLWSCLCISLAKHFILKRKSSYLAINT